MNDNTNIDIRQLQEARLLVDTNPGQVFEYALNKSAIHTKILARTIQIIPEDIATKAIGMFASEIQHTDFKTAINKHGHLRFDNRRFDALNAMANVGSLFFTKHAQARKDVLDAMSTLDKLLRLALDTVNDNSLRPSRRLPILRVVRDAICSMRNVGDEGQAYLGRQKYWLPIISAWLVVEDSTIHVEGDSILSGLLVISDRIFNDEKGAKEKFLTEVFARACGEHMETKAKNIVRVALGRIRRAMPVFTVNGDDSALSISLHVLFLLNEIKDDSTSAFDHTLRDALVDLGGIQDMKEILRVGMEHSRWVTVSTTLGVVCRHFSAIASSITIKRSLDIGLVKMVLNASKEINQLNHIARESISTLVQDYIPGAFILRSVVKDFDIDELLSSSANDTDQQWRKVALAHEGWKNSYKALVRRNGKEEIRCANPNCDTKESNSARFRSCAKCQWRLYCSNACQEQSWNGHRSECRSICDIIGALRLKVPHSDIKYLLRIVHDEAQHFIDETKEVPSSGQAIFVLYSQKFRSEDSCETAPAVSITNDVQVHESAILPDLQFHYEDNFLCRILISFTLCGEVHAFCIHSKLRHPETQDHN